MRLNCLSAAVITALLMAVSVFIGNVAHTEYNSQVRKHKAKKIAKQVETSDAPIEVPAS